MLDAKSSKLKVKAPAYSCAYCKVWQINLEPAHIVSWCPMGHIQPSTPPDGPQNVNEFRKCSHLLVLISGRGAVCPESDGRQLAKKLYIQYIFTSFFYYYFKSNPHRRSFSLRKNVVEELCHTSCYE